MTSENTLFSILALWGLVLVLACAGIFFWAALSAWNECRKAKRPK